MNEIIIEEDLDPVDENLWHNIMETVNRAREAKDSSKVKSLYTEDGFHTRDAMAITRDASSLLRTLYQKYIDQGYKPHEILWVIDSASRVVSAEMMAKLRRESRPPVESQEEKRSNFSQVSPGVGSRKDDV